MATELLEWIRAANGLLLEAYYKEAQECRLCWIEGEIRFLAQTKQTSIVIKAAPFDADSYLQLFYHATKIIDKGSYFQLRVPNSEKAENITYQIDFLTGENASECIVRLVLTPNIDNGSANNFEEEELYDSTYLN